MKTAALRLHILFMAIAVCALAGQLALVRPSLHVDMPGIAIVLTQRVFAGAAFIAGLVSMAARSGKSESLLLGLSTIAAFFLMLATGYLRA